MRELANVIEEVVTVRVRVRVAHGNVDIVVVMLQRKFEAEGVKIRRFFLINTNYLRSVRRELATFTVLAVLLAVYLAQWLIVLVVSNVIA